MIIKRAAVLLLALTCAPVVFAAEYLIEAELWLDGESAGRPVLLVKAGEPASIERGAGDASTGWRLTIEVEPADTDPLAPSGSLWLQVEVQRQDENGWSAVADSILGVPEGDTATLSVVDGDAESRPETAAVYLRIKTSRLLEGRAEDDSLGAR